MRAELFFCVLTTQTPGQRFGTSNHLDGEKELVALF